jgi:hypothetical protein
MYNLFHVIDEYAHLAVWVNMILQQFKCLVLSFPDSAHPCCYVLFDRSINYRLMSLMFLLQIFGPRIH